MKAPADALVVWRCSDCHKAVGFIRRLGGRLVAEFTEAGPRMGRVHGFTKALEGSFNAPREGDPVPHLLRGMDETKFSPNRWTRRPVDALLLEEVEGGQLQVTCGRHRSVVPPAALRSLGERRRERMSPIPPPPATGG